MCLLADPLEVEVVRILAVVDELDDDLAGLHLAAREAVAVLLRDDLNARWSRGRVGSRRDHAMRAYRENDDAFGMTAAASTLNHCSRSDA